MKTWCTLLVALTALVLSGGCSKPETVGPVVEQNPAGGRFSAQLPTGFAGKNIQLGGKCWIDTFNGKKFSPQNEADRSGALTVDGWAIDGSSAAAPLVAVELAAPGGQSYYAPAQRATRAGLGEALKNPALDAAALASTASLADVPLGNYVVKLLVGDANSATRCEPGLSLLVK